MKKHNYTVDVRVNNDGTHDIQVSKEETKMSKGKKIGIITGIVALLAAIGGGICYLFGKKPEETTDNFEEFDEDPDDETTVDEDENIEVTEF